MYEPEYTLSAALIEFTVSKLEEILTDPRRGAHGALVEGCKILKLHFPVIKHDFEMAAALPEGTVDRWIVSGRHARSDNDIAMAYATKIIAAFNRQLERYKLHRAT